MDALKKNASDIERKLTGLRKFVERLNTDYETKSELERAILVKELQLRVQRYRDLLYEFEAVDSELVLLGEESKSQVFEDAYFAVMAVAETFLERIDGNLALERESNESGSSVASRQTGSSVSSGQTGSSVASRQSSHLPRTPGRVRLPEIQLPTFRGDFDGWLEYRDIFLSVIHESTLDDINKFLYLKRTLVGPAAEVIKAIEVSADNYELAWAAVRERFDNKRKLLDNHLSALFSLKPVGKESHSDLRNLLDTVNKHLRALETLGQSVAEWDPMVIYLVTTKLDAQALREWEVTRQNNDFPTLDQLKTFLKNRADLLEAIAGKAGSEKKERPPPRNIGRSTAMVSAVECSICDEGHNASECSALKRMELSERVTTVKKHRLCFNCLKKGHMGNQCSAARCEICGRRHHKLLHDSSGSETASPAPTTNMCIENPDTAIVGSAREANGDHGCVLLSTAAIQVRDGYDHFQKCRVLLDSGSQSNFITRDCVRKLGIQSESATLRILGIGASSSTATARCEIAYRSMTTSHSSSLVCYVVPVISTALPNVTIDVAGWSMPERIRSALADPHFAETGPIDILIGATAFWRLLCVGQLQLGLGMPVLQKTLLGWIVSGPTSTGCAGTSRPHCAFSGSATIQRQLERFWELEQVSHTRTPSPEHDKCEAIFNSTTRRQADGRFVVSIPLKYDPERLGESRSVAMKRFLAMERRFRRDDRLRQNYSAFVQDYIDQGHMSKTSEDVLSLNYLPHHCVSSDGSSSAKFRVVFEGSCKTSSGYSLNDIQMVGPVVQDDLFTILFRFREYPVVVSADVAQMYRQILIEPSMRRLQCILWRSEPTAAIDTYTLNTVTYGTSSASYLATRVLMQLAQENEESHPEATSVIKRCFYVDDLLAGFLYTDEAIRVCREVDEILRQGKYRLRKWLSNKGEVLQGLRASVGEACSLDLDPEMGSKTLGLQWAFANDYLTYRVRRDDTKGVSSKRTILSRTAQIFDPLGLVGPCVVIAKLILQELWILKLTWDESIPLALHTAWNQFLNDLPALNELAIPRQVVGMHPSRLQLHGFSDASQRAYGACLYYRSEDVDGRVCVRLMCSKSRVAPLKTQSIPRLELCAALTLAELTHKINVNSGIAPEADFLWTDSTAVLGWMKKSPHSLEVFVGNRVAEISRLVPDARWNYVTTNENPADLLSRGGRLPDLASAPSWWNGPKWLQERSENWPVQRQYEVYVAEIALPVRNVIAPIQKSDWIGINNFSRLHKLCRVAAYSLRYLNNLRSAKAARKGGPLSSQELNEALLELVRIAQRETCSYEIDALATPAKRLTRGPMLRLAPFMDEVGIIRVGGRLRLSSFPYAQRHPIVLPRRHHLSWLIAESEHLRLLHAGPGLLLSTLRLKFWIISARNLVRKVVRQCRRCQRQVVRPIAPVMGELPAARTLGGHPFLAKGIDYAGPISTRDRKGRNFKTIKAYICLFICFSTKAVHLEAVSDLTTQAFIMTFRRFVARRGLPNHVYSDNGLNFVGAKSELLELGKFLLTNSDDIANEGTRHRVQWHFIPAYAPHFGGLWEAGVKSVKFHLKRVIGNALLTFEELTTVLTQIESVLNSRPLAPLTNDISDLLEAPTPAHFLVGRSLLDLPDPDLGHLPENRLSIYQRLQAMRQHFWRRWSTEYVPELQKRVKWHSSRHQLLVGDIVVIKDDALPPLQWSLGRITELIPGKDGIARLAWIKTAAGPVKRAWSKMCRLPPIDDEQR